MSFSNTVKIEMSRTQESKHCCALAELYGILLLASVFSKTEIRIMTKNPILFKHLTKLSKELLMPAPAWRSLSTGSSRTTITLDDAGDIERIFELFEYDISSQVVLHLNNWLVLEDCCRAAFLRGLFLTGGYIANPEKNYYLELSGTHSALMNEIYVLLSELELSPKYVQRDTSHVIYFKESSLIERYLTLAGAHGSVLRFMEVRVIKDVRNTINRKVNCETANLLKSVEAGNVQLEAIEKLKQHGKLDELDEKLREAAALREQHPDEPISALAARANPPVSKSGMNHRLRRLFVLAEKLEKEEELLEGTQDKKSDE